MRLARVLQAQKSDTDPKSAGIPTLNFGVPALAFLVTLHIVDIFFVRPPEEVRKWGPLRFMAQLVAFPNESPDQNPFRMIYRIPNLALSAFFANLLLYLTPSPAIYASLTPWSWPFIFYSGASGLMVLILLGFVVDTVFLLISSATFQEMHPLFNNPIGASVSLRDFWARWNLAIKASLGSAVFKLLQSDEQAPVSRRLRRDLNYASERFLPGFTKRGKKRYADQLDETETELDSAATSAANSPVASEDESSERRKSLRRRTGANGVNGVQMNPVKPAPKDKRAPAKGAPAKRGGKKKTSSAMKIFAALATFFVSGLAHEYMNVVAFGWKYMNFENMIFFMTVGSSQPNRLPDCADSWSACSMESPCASRSCTRGRSRNSCPSPTGSAGSSSRYVSTELVLRAFTDLAGLRSSCGRRPLCSSGLSCGMASSNTSRASPCSTMASRSKASSIWPGRRPRGSKAK